MKAWRNINLFVTDVQQSKSRDAVERQSRNARKPIVMIEPPGLSASQLPSFSRLLL